jgi:RNA polymerase sigma-70 factor (ECF subfamily)
MKNFHYHSIANGLHCLVNPACSAVLALHLCCEKAREVVVSSQDFHQQLISLMPKMRVWALALTRNGAAADDLVQDVAAKALGANDAFEPGTNFSAWVHRIMVNHFISGMRTRREYTDIDALADLPMAAAHEDHTALRELSWAINRLPADQKEALFLIVLDEKSYENASEASGCPIGTLKSRVHRARVQLRAYMDGTSQKAA